MHKIELDILQYLIDNPIVDYRLLSKKLGYSQNQIKRAIDNLIDANYLDVQYQLTEKAHSFLSKHKVESAIILAAGLGLRMMPINASTPKALVEVHGETLIERLIKQLKEVGIHNIFVVVGFMKESFEFLIDQYDVKLIVNNEYLRKNSLYSLYKVQKHIEHSYIIPCDLWFEENPFHAYEFYSWYMVKRSLTRVSLVRVNRKGELVKNGRNAYGNKMVGLCYLEDEPANYMKQRLVDLSWDPEHSNAYWEEALFHQRKMVTLARIVPSEAVYEISTYEDLREVDEHSDHLRADAIEVAAETLGVLPQDIEEITILKKGMTNRSFLFTCKKKKYIMRIPGEGTNKLLSRYQEAAVYEALKGTGISDTVLYLNPENGYKITEYIDNAVTCNPENEKHVRACMHKLRQFHEMELKVEHDFDIFERIEYFESLWKEPKSIYRDYKVTKEHIYSLKEFIDSLEKKHCLTHIDAVPDNFIFAKGSMDDIRMIDWEYAGMQDPHVDIAVFCIYAMYDYKKIDETITAYFEEEVPLEIRAKIYCYIAIFGLIWSNWCEYKLQFGIEFGEYALAQYRYAKEYYQKAKGLIETVHGT